MKIDCGETYAEWDTRTRQWHPFFAILPRQVGSHDCRFLEWIERRRVVWNAYWAEEWEYRAKQ